jgi:hypothetical protein
MVVIALCAALVVAGVVLVVRWGAQPGRDDGAPGLAGWLRYAGAALAAGAVAGVLAAGPGEASATAACSFASRRHRSKAPRTRRCAASSPGAPACPRGACASCAGRPRATRSYESKA